MSPPTRPAATLDTVPSPPAATTASCARAASRAARRELVGSHAAPGSAPRPAARRASSAASRCSLAAPPPASRLRMRATRTGGSLAVPARDGDDSPERGMEAAAAGAGAGSGPAPAVPIGGSWPSPSRRPRTGSSATSSSASSAATSARGRTAGSPLLRLVTQRDIETVYAEIAAILETDRRLRRRRTSSSSRATSSTSRRAATASSPPTRSSRRASAPAAAARSRASPRRAAAGTATEELRGLLGYTSRSSGARCCAAPPATATRRACSCARSTRPAWSPSRSRVTPEGPRADLSLDTERLLRRCEQRLAPEQRQRQRPALHAHRRDAAAAASTRAARCSRRSPSAGTGGPWLVRCARIWVPTAFNVDSFERGGVAPRAPARPARHDRLRPLPRRRAAGRPRRDARLHVRLQLRLPGPQGLGRAAARLRAGVRRRGGRDAPAQGAHDPHLARRPCRRASPPSCAAPACPRRGCRTSGSWPRTCPRRDLPGLYTAADAYVSPTRGEGWGRPLMEALACGTPVIASRWSAQLAFLDDDNAQLVDGRVIDVPDDVDIAVFRGQRWFDPDVDALRAAMRAVRSDPAGAARARPRRPARGCSRSSRRPAIAERIAELDPRGALTGAARLHDRRPQLPRARPHAGGVVPRAPPRRPLHGAGDGRAVRAPAARRRRVRRARAAPDRPAGGRARADADAVRRQGARDGAQADAARLAAGARRDRGAVPRPGHRGLRRAGRHRRAGGAARHRARRRTRWSRCRATTASPPSTACTSPASSTSASSASARAAAVPALVGRAPRARLRRGRRAGPVRRPEVGRLRALLLGPPRPARPRLQRRVLEPADARASRAAGAAGRSTARRCASSTTAATRRRGRTQLSKFQSEPEPRHVRRAPAAARRSATTTRRGWRPTGSPSAARCPYAFDAPGGLVADAGRCAALTASAEGLRARRASSCRRTRSCTARRRGSSMLHDRQPGRGAGARPAARCRRAGSPCLAFAEELAADAELLAALERRLRRRRRRDARDPGRGRRRGGDERRARGPGARRHRRRRGARHAAPRRRPLRAAAGRRRAGGLHPPGAARRAARPAPRRRPDARSRRPPDPEPHA